MKFSCNPCNYESNDQSNYNRHLKSKAHSEIQSTKPKVKSRGISNKVTCDACNKKFASRQGLSRHKKIIV